MKKNFSYLILGMFTALTIGAMSNPVTWLEKMFLPQNNFVNPGFEANDTGLCLGDASGAAPTTDQSCSGSPSLTKSFETTNPIDGNRSIKISKGAANRQGEFVALDFTIDRSQINKSNTLEFKYSATSNFVYGDSGDIKVYIADKTTSQVYATYPNTLDGSGLFTAQWAATDNRNYQLILWIPTTTTLDWDLTLDSFKNKLSDLLTIRTVNPVYSAQIDGSDVVTNETADFINGNCTNATTGRSTCVYTTGFWNGRTPNCTATVPRAAGVGIATIVSESASQIIIETNNDSGTAANYGFTLHCQDSTPNPDIKVAGAVIPNIPVEMYAIKTSGSTTGSAAMSFTEVKDSDNAFNGTTFTVKSPGTYRVNVIYHTTATNTGNCQIRKNGSAVFITTSGNSTRCIVSGDLVDLVPGDTITFVPTATFTSDTDTTFNITRVNNPNSFLTIPRTIQCSAKVSDAGVVSNEMCNFGTTHDWLSGNCSNGTTGTFGCTANTRIFSSTPNCWADENHGIPTNADVNALASSATAISVGSRNQNTGTNDDVNFTLICQGKLIQ